MQDFTKRTWHRRSRKYCWRFLSVFFGFNFWLGNKKSTVTVFKNHLYLRNQEMILSLFLFTMLLFLLINSSSLMRAYWINLILLTRPQNSIYLITLGAGIFSAHKLNALNLLIFCTEDKVQKLGDLSYLCQRLDG